MSIDELRCISLHKQNLIEQVQYAFLFNIIIKLALELLKT